jgi:hypothetical protein
MSTRSGLRTSLLRFSVSGDGSGVAEFDFFPRSNTIRQSGRVRRIVVREPAGGGATATDIYFFSFGTKDVADPATADQGDVVIMVDDLVLTASATAVSLDSPITSEPTFQDSLVAVFDVTATGEWTISGWIEVES